jgi:hypothetical protein
MPRITFNVNITGEIRIHPDTAHRGVVLFATQKGITVGEITVRADEMTLKATVMLTDSEGNPTTADDVPVWAVGDDTVLTVTPSGDGLSASFEVGAPGVSSVTVTTTETHEGEGEPTPIVLSGLVTVVAGDTVTGSVDFTTEQQP